MIRHLVIFEFDKTKAKQEIIQEIKNELETLPTIIPELKKIEVGININPAEKQDLSLTADLDTLDDLALYNQHPAHLAVGAKIRSILTQRTCVDYHI